MKRIDDRGDATPFPKKFEVDACLPWLRAELTVVKPEVLVILGATRPARR